MLDIEFHYNDGSIMKQSMSWSSAYLLYHKDFLKDDWNNYKIKDWGREVKIIEDPELIKKIFNSFSSRYKSLRNWVIPDKLPIKIYMS